MKRRVNEPTNQRVSNRMYQRRRTRATQRIRCGTIVRYLCDHLDEGLNSRRCREIRRHLKNCPNCTAYLDSLKKTISLYKRVRNPHSRRWTKPDLNGLLLVQERSKK
ncbi:MAG: zf-HC2 domain-containing protein [Ignavibacterium sp.]